jgi:signal transduction histidine kinase
MQMVSGSHIIRKEGDISNVSVAADRQRIEQVLANLLSNAVKYSPGKNEVIVSGKKNGKDLIIKIRDFGIGIPHEDRKNVFERFYRSENTGQTISGFGLGLYICKNIISRHEGSIWAEEEKPGTSIYFTLPYIVTDSYN